MEKQITCIICPVGCEITVCGEGEHIDSIEGFSCKRGETYARTEFIHPVRILTSTVKMEGTREPLLPVRSSMPIAKELQLACIHELRKLTVHPPVARHQVLIANILNTGADIIATATDAE